MGKLVQAFGFTVLLFFVGLMFSLVTPAAWFLMNPGVLFFVFILSWVYLLCKK